MRQTQQSIDNGTSADLAELDMPPVTLFARPVLGGYRFVSMEPSSGEELITLIRIPSILARAFVAEPTVERYRGSCTVWHSFPDFKRQGTLMEGMLNEFLERATFERKNSRS